MRLRYALRLGKFTNCPNELHFYPRVLQSLAIFGSNGDCALHRLAIHVQRDLFFPVLVEFNIDHSPLIGVLQDDVDVDRGGEEIRHVRLRLALEIPKGL